MAEDDGEHTPEDLAELVQRLQRDCYEKGRKDLAEKVAKEFKFSIRNDTYMEWDEKQLVEIDRVIDAVIEYILQDGGD